MTAAAQSVLVVHTERAEYEAPGPDDDPIAVDYAVENVSADTVAVGWSFNARYRIERRPPDGAPFAGASYVPPWEIPAPEAWQSDLHWGFPEGSLERRQAADVSGLLLLAPGERIEWRVWLREPGEYRFMADYSLPWRQAQRRDAEWRAAYSAPFVLR